MRPPLRPTDDDPEAPAIGEPETARPGDAQSSASRPPGGVAPNHSGDSGHSPADLIEILDPIPAVDPVENPFSLSPRELLFVEAFLGAAHFRAARAYELAGYKVTGAASRANASRMLTRERVAKAIAAELGARAKALRIMDGDEALEGISALARSDIRKVFPPTHWIAKLPDEVAACIKSVRPGKHGYTIELYDKGHHLEVMAKVSGRLKETLKVEHTLEDILARSHRLDDGASA